MLDGHSYAAHSHPRRAATIGALLVAAVMVEGCVGPFAPTPLASGSPTPSASLSPTATTSPTLSARPTATPEPPLSLALPAARDGRHIRVSVQPTVPQGGTGHVTIKVVNLASTRVAELVLRWPTPLNRIVFLAPFQPSSGRLSDALVQPWTKWVIGPGEQREPEGTTSLGWGPLDPGATLTISLIATRRARGPVAFDLQVLAGEALLTTEAGAPAETRVSIP
jgi:hypothetical protein